MIRELRIKNLALIDVLNLEFDEGFSIFTGETGAGKSILIGAIGLLLGERASADLIRSGCEDAEVSGIFYLKNASRPLKELLDELTIEPEDSQLIIRRKISHSDRNRIHVNQVPLPLSSLKKLGDLLIDFHGQHEHQSLLNEESHLCIIDNLPGVRELKQNYEDLYKAYTEAQTALQQHESKAKSLAERKEILEFQFNELKNLGLKAGEEEELESELRLLSSATERISCTSEVLALLSGSPESIEKKIIALRKKLETLAKYDTSLNQWLSDVEHSLTLFTELDTFCSSYLEHTEDNADPARIELINSRLAKIQRLKKKYSCSLEQLIEKQGTIKKDLSSIENATSDRIVLQKTMHEAYEQCTKAGSKLTAARKRASADFDTQISRLMEMLGFKGGQWNTSFTPLPDPALQGLESIRFLVRTNPGEPMLPLAKSASGGEISRLMLAIKTVLAEHDHIPVLIFDEIDTGIGGVLAGEVANSLYKLSRYFAYLIYTRSHHVRITISVFKKRPLQIVL